MAELARQMNAKHCGNAKRQNNVLAFFLIPQIRHEGLLLQDLPEE